MQPAFTLLSPHKRARIIGFLLLVLMWTAGVVFGVLCPKARHMEQRWGWLDLSEITRHVYRPAIIRTVEFAQIKEAPRRYNFVAPDGFRRKPFDDWLRPIIAVRPPATTFKSADALAPLPADSS